MEFTFTLTEEEANLMLSALMELPYKVSAGLIQKVNRQAMDQRQNPQN